MNNADSDWLEARRKLPEDMHGIYREYFSSLLEKEFGGDSNKYQAVLSPILAARVPLPEVVWRDSIIQRLFNRSVTCESGCDVTPLNSSKDLQESTERFDTESCRFHDC